MECEQSPPKTKTIKNNSTTGGTPEGRAKVISEEPIGRMGRPEEIATTVLWLYSEGAGFVVGHDLVVDGGQTV
jgi:NAD(P)-dependent dehydrogenase (short-subunit alcohol dehydrogenase family)